MSPRDPHPLARGSCVALALAVAACATTPPPAASVDRWRAELDVYRARRATLAADVRHVLDDFRTLRAESSFPGLEDAIATLAARVRLGEEPDDPQTLTRSLWSLSLGELGLFQRYLALSSRLIELEAVHAELEALRLELWLRRLTLDVAAEPARETLEQPPPPPFACGRYTVGRIELVSCADPVRP